MKIEVIPNIISQQQISEFMSDVNPKENAKPMTYFNGHTDNSGVNKIKCSDHPLVQYIIDRIEYKNVESVSVVYYKTGSYNAPHADNCVIDNGIVTKVKDWTHTGIVFLNKEFSGGELVYPNQGCVFLPTVGTMVITPAGEEYIHFVEPIKTGERFTLVFRFL